MLPNKLHYSYEIKILLFQIHTQSITMQLYLVQNENNTDYYIFCYSVPETLIHMFWECVYVQNLLKTIWDLVSIFTTENIDTEMFNIILCTYNKETQIYTLISTIVKAYIFACKYADKIPEPVECWHKIEYYLETERLIHTKNNKIHKYIAKCHPF